MKIKLSKTLFIFAIALVPVAAYCGWFSPITGMFGSKGNDMKEVTLTREVIIKDESDSVPEPQVISSADDGGFIIAGNLGRAWAIKTDAAGKVIWRNLQAQRDDARYAVAYTGAVAMPDGSTYLCGNMSQPEGYTPSLLIHIGAAGQLLDEQLFVPQDRTKRGLSYFDDCIRWGGGVVIIGHVHDTKRQASGYGTSFLPPITENYYWLLMLDSSGKLEWEKQLPTTFNGITSVKAMLNTTDDSLVLAGDGMMGKTEIFRISTSGKLLASKLLTGKFQFVRPVIPDGILQVYGDHNDTNDSNMLITLDSSLEELRRVPGKQSPDFSTHMAYRMHDQSLILFGSAVHTFGERYASGIVHVDPTLQFAQKLELAHSQFTDGGTVDAAAPTGNNGEFVTARKLLKHQPNEGRIGMAPVGVALDFIQIK